MSMTVTVFFEDPFYVGWVEHCEDSRLTVAKIVFGAEPSDAEVWRFLLQHMDSLRFSPPVDGVKPFAIASNPKRRQRQAAHATTRFLGTKAQQALSLAHAEAKQERRQQCRAHREAEEERKLEIRIAKKKARASGALTCPFFINQGGLAMSDHSAYISPFSTRYASKDMQFIFSEDNKFRTWRKLWIALAKAEKAQGLAITDEQIAELEAHQDDINYEDAQRRERECRHDVMSHVYAYGLQCPKAKGILHLGATSCYVGDNTDVIIMKQGLQLIRRKVLNVLDKLAKFADEYKAMPCLAYTHIQPAQLTTVGKRATLWMNELYMDYLELEHRLNSLALLGSKGTTGTQASFMELFGGDAEKIRHLEQDIAQQMGFDRVVPVSGQTYSRKMDYFVVSTLSGIAQSASKFSYDLRLLQSFKEMEEPFEKQQIGSSAMPYKRNPMRSERISALSRYVMVDTLNAAITSATQFFERTLDDSANRRISVSEAFLGVDAILNVMLNVCDGLVVYPKVIHARVMNELPFMATENILMDAVKRGGDRQQLHERLRVHSQAAGNVVKEEGLPNDLLSRIAADPLFQTTEAELQSLLDPALYTGRSAQQVDEFLSNLIRPLLTENAALLGEHETLTV